jgi:nucleotide-binding universal stress UspA family protein
MIVLKTVVCPVDFSAATPRQIDMAVDLCRAFGGRLVVHHNRHALGTSASVGWMWKADHPGESPAAVEAKLSECLARVPDGVKAEGLMTEGPASRAVLEVVEAVDADLVVLTTHGTHADTHASITQQVLERSHRPVLALHEPVVETRTPHFASPGAERQAVLTPTDFTPASHSAVALGLDLARKLPIELHLLHLLPNGRLRRARADASSDEALRRLQALVPEELADRVKLHVDHGDPVAGIASAAGRLSAACIVMGEHTRTPLGWFSRDTSRGVLDQARCPVWYVPAARPAAAYQPAAARAAATSEPAEPAL